MQSHGKQLAGIALEIDAIKLRPSDPFTWVSGYRMPIYNDNRLFLGDHRHRALIAEGFSSLIDRIGARPDVIAGTSTAGISPGTTLADRLERPFIYIRDKAKEHGLQNRIEGILREDQRAVLVEDLISTGGSSIDAVLAIRDQGGIIDQCVSIFSYGFREAEERFHSIGCSHHPLLTFDTLLEVAKERSALSPADVGVLREWREAPFEWGERHGFPKREKG